MFGGNCIRCIFEIYFINYHKSMPFLKILLSASNKCPALCMVILRTREGISYPIQLLRLGFEADTAAERITKS